MHIWIDADACPKPIKEILFRAATRTGIAVTLIANQMLAVPRSPYIRALQVPKGFDVADNEIAKGAKVLTPRGEPYDKGSIAAALTLRNFMDTLRSTGGETGGPAAFSASDQHTSARQLDRELAGRKA